MDSGNKAMQTTKRVFATAASLAASAVVVRSLCNEFLPPELQGYFSYATHALRMRLSSQHTIVIEEIEHFSVNKIYAAVNTYLATKISKATRRLKVSKHTDDQRNMAVSPEEGEEMTDNFQGAQFKWRLLCKENPQPYSTSRDMMNGRVMRMSGPSETRFFELSFHKKHQEMAMDEYLPYILELSRKVTSESRVIKLHMNDADYWRPINLHHPATFDTLAMDSKLKQEVMDDLERFIKRKDYYKKTGKAWKRGYLLYGPPGTGKSSLVAAMANHLKFDIYDLELTEVTSNSTLRRLLVGMGNKSILVVEDIDCSMELQQREDCDGSSERNKGQGEKVTLSGLLNFVDGLWSSCGEERIIVFTTNYKDRLDPALLRPGRMDMHIHMGYCGASEFRVLASNYHDIDDHPLFGEIEGLMKEVEVTPAQVAEKLMSRDDKEAAFRGLLEFLQEKKGCLPEAEHC